MKLLAIVTPTYNRADLLNNLYLSLVNQTSTNFKWYIIDDGSKDNTKEVCESFIKEKKIDIEFVSKENGGKHTALNTAMSIVKEELTFIVDSDDTLTPNAIEIVEKYYDQIKAKDDVCGIGFLKIRKGNGTFVGKKYSKNLLIDYFINERINRNIYGDKAEIFKTSILKKYPFPVFEGEKFVSESTVWCDISLNYKMLFVNEGIYICEYQDTGLSASIHKTLFKNPNGAVACYLKMSSKKVRLKYRFKYTIAVAVYSFVAKKHFKEIFKKIDSKFLFVIGYIPAYFIYLRKRRRYKKI